ncbi:Rhomboid family member 1, partial [Termitomyces sp. T112]
MILLSQDEKTRLPSHFGDSEHDNSYNSPRQDAYSDNQHLPGPSDAASRPPLFRQPSNDDMTTPSPDDYNYHELPSSKRADSKASLVYNAADISRSSHYEDLEYAEPAADRSMEKKSSLTNFLAQGRYPLEQRIENKKRGIGRQKYPFVVWILTCVMIGVFINELIVNSRAQGTPVSMKPVVNPMLGPSSDALINLGARFAPCMKLVDDIPPATQFGCLNNTANPPTRICPLEDICGFGGFHGASPNQWFRFIVPIFLHAGFIHIILNMLAQLTLSAQIEREMGSTGFFITYFAAGIFGNVLGGNFSLVGVPSVGASGAIFGTVAVTWIDLFAHWKYQY